MNVALVALGAACLSFVVCLRIDVLPWNPGRGAITITDPSNFPDPPFVIRVGGEIMSIFASQGSQWSTGSGGTLRYSFRWFR